MATFAYRGVAGKGGVVSGTIEAADRKQVLARLRLQGIKPLHVGLADGGGQGRDAAAVMPPPVAAPATGGSGFSSATPAADAEAAVAAAVAESGGDAKRSNGFARFRSSRALALPFLLKLRQLHGGGMPIGEVLQVMANRMSDVQLKALSQQLYKDLSEGRTLAASIRAQPEVFDPALSHLIEAGEATGNLVPILDNIIANLQASRALTKKVRAALAYPFFLIGMALVVVGLFLFFLLPMLENLLVSMGGEMSFVARLTIEISEFALQKGPFIMGALLLLGLFLLRWRKTPNGRRKTDEWLLRLPLVRSLVYNADICRATNVLSILLGNGVNTTESLRLAENTLQNTILRGRFAAARNSINDGSNFSAAFKRYGLLPDLDVDILSIGESTGSLVSSFDEVYNSHAEELTARISFVTKLVSGIALGSAFLLISIIALSMVISVMSVGQSMQI